MHMKIRPNANMMAIAVVMKSGSSIDALIASMIELIDDMMVEMIPLIAVPSSDAMLGAA